MFVFSQDLHETLTFITELIKIRNSLAHHIVNNLVKVDGKSHMAPLPAIVSDQQTCKYCPQRRNCALYNRYCLNYVVIFQLYLKKTLDRLH